MTEATWDKYGRPKVQKDLSLARAQAEIRTTTTSGRQKNGSKMGYAKKDC